MSAESGNAPPDPAIFVKCDENLIGANAKKAPVGAFFYAAIAGAG